MTDWLPWGGLLIGTRFATLWALTRDGDPARNRRRARDILVAGGVLTVFGFVLSLLLGESWLPYV